MIVALPGLFSYFFWRGYVYVGGCVSIVWDVITIKMALMKIHKKLITLPCICL